PGGAPGTTVASAPGTFTVDTSQPFVEFAIREGSETGSTRVTLDITRLQPRRGGAPLTGLRVRDWAEGLPPAQGWREYDLSAAPLTSLPWELPAGDGFKTVEMQVGDGVGWSGSFYQTIHLDTTPPRPPVWKAVRGGVQAIQVAWYEASDATPAGDPGSGVVGYDLEYDRSGDTAGWLPWASGLTELERDLQNAGLGHNERVVFRIRARDRVGLVSAWSEKTAYTLPEESLLSLVTTGQDGVWGHYLQLRIDLVAAADYAIELLEGSDPGGNGTDPLHPIFYEGGVPYYRDGGLMPHGRYRYRVVTLNPLGERTFGPAQEFMVDNIPPSRPQVVAPNEPEAGWVNRDRVVLQFRAGGDVDLDQLTYTFSLWDEGDHYLVQDQVIPPEMVLKGVTPEVAGLVDGKTYYWRLKVTDNYGASTLSEKAQFRVDLTPPHINVGPLAEDWVPAQEIKVEASDAGSGLARLAYQWNEGPDWILIGSGETLSAPQGANLLTVRAVDVAGNETVTAPGYLVKVDQTPPALAGVQVQGAIPVPQPGSGTITWVSSNRDGLLATWRLQDLESGVAGYRCSLVREGQAADLSQLPWREEAGAAGSYRVFVPGVLADGEVWRVAVQGRNKVGLATEVELSQPVLIDGSAPQVSVRVTGGVREVGGNLYTGDFSRVQLQVNAADPHSGIAEIRYLLTEDPAATQGEEGVAALEDLLAAQNLVNGAAYYLVVRVKNGAGLVAEASTPAIRLDHTPPVIASLKDEGTVQRERTQLAFQVEAGDPESGLASLRYAIGTQAGSADVSADLAGAKDGWVEIKEPLPRLDVVVGGLDLGEEKTYYITVVAANGAGGETRLSTDGITVNSSLPAAPRVVDDG
ncbi:MAG: hypothetical protein QJR13_08940, partial [Bacillota bacterium]|nr:hypothetical protein [Bacillota bacterium]